jgi:alpha-L-fucosidase
MRFSRALLMLCILAICFSFIGPARAQDDTREPIKAWQDKRFGMFIHWGPVSLKGTEIGWSRGRQVPNAEYDALYRQFNPSLFDAQEWVSVAKAAGMKYLVITSKHHDGFCLWPSEYTDYHIGNSPFKRDVLKELSDACQQQGIQFCTYYSVCDWYHPDYPLDSPGGSRAKATHNMPRYYQYVKDQTREIIDNYGPLGIMWFDGEWEKPWTQAYGNELYTYLKQIQPSLIINNRVSKGRHGMAGTTRQSDLNAGDYDTPEQRVGGFNRDRPWETCMTICRQWAWKPKDHMKSLTQCIQTLLQTAGGDGNLLFNVGPMPDGRIEPRQVTRLQEMGAWLQDYGEGVYGTRGGPFKPGKWGASTCKGNKIYLYIMNWPESGPLTLPKIQSTIRKVQLLSKGQVKVRQTDTGMVIDVPKGDRREIATVVVLTVQGQAFDIQPMSIAAGSKSLASGKSASASNVFMKMEECGPAMALDDDPDTRWATDTGTTAAWLEVDLGQALTVQGVAIKEPDAYQRIRSFKLQYQDGNMWQTFHKGTSIGPDWSIKVKPFKARRVRLNILKATDGPTIEEFQLFPQKP